MTDQARLSATLTLRVPPPLRAALESIANTQNRTLAEVVREAFAEYIERQP